MSQALKSIKQGLGEAIAHAKAKGANKPVGMKPYHPQTVDVPALRARLGFTQKQFAARFDRNPSSSAKPAVFAPPRAAASVPRP